MIALLAEPDLVWIETVVDVVERQAGQPWRTALEQLDDLQRALQLRPLQAHAWQRHGYAPDRSQPTTARRFRAVVSAVQRVTSTRARNVRVAREARGLVLGHPALDAASRAARIAHAAGRLGVTPDALEATLWSDLPRERPIELPAGRPAELEVAAFANVALLQAAMRRAGAITLTIDTDDPGALVRAAAARGLLVTATAVSAVSGAPGSRTRLDIVGPLSLVRRTGVYGRALSQLVPLLATWPRWSLDITVELPLTTYAVHIDTPVLLPGPSARDQSHPYALSKLHAALLRAEPTLPVVAAPPMLRAGERLLFPDLAVEVAGRVTYIELVGFWTRSYLERRVADYGAAGERVLLCADLERGADESDLPEAVLGHRKQVSADRVLGRLRE